MITTRCLIGCLLLSAFHSLAGAQDPGDFAKDRLPAPAEIEQTQAKEPLLMDDRRLPLLTAPVGTTPKPSAETLKRFSEFVDRVVDPENTFDLIENRTRLMVFKQPPKRVQTVDETTLTTTLLGVQQLSLTGKKVGSTVLTIWFPSKQDPNLEEVLTYLVRVLPDPELRERTEKTYDLLAKEVNKAFPDSVIKLTLVGDKLLLTGEAKDVQEAYQILRIVRANAPRGNQQRLIPVTQLNLNVPNADAFAGENADLDSEQGLQNFLTAGGPNVINQLRIPGEQQVMLRVTVAELNRAAARSVGINFTLTSGSFSLAQLTGGLFGQGGQGVGGGANLNNVGIANIASNFNVGGTQVALAINALKTLNLARSLAEPNLVTINGRAASFRAGGEFPVPVVTGATATGLQGVQFVPFGVSLQFTPVITDRDRIRLQVNADVSTRDNTTAQTSINGAGVSSLSTRNFNTTVELREGQTLAVAGLLQTNLGLDSSRLPWLGDIPVLGKAFGFDRHSQGEQELIILVTPELVRPLERGEKPCLPGDRICPSSDLEFYLGKRLYHANAVSNTGSASAATAIMAPASNPSQEMPRKKEKMDPPVEITDPLRKQRIEQLLLQGPSGFVEKK